MAHLRIFMDNVVIAIGAIVILYLMLAFEVFTIIGEILGAITDLFKEIFGRGERYHSEEEKSTKETLQEKYDRIDAYNATYRNERKKD